MARTALTGRSFRLERPADLRDLLPPRLFRTLDVPSGVPGLDRAVARFLARRTARMIGADISTVGQDRPLTTARKAATRFLHLRHRRSQPSSGLEIGTEGAAHGHASFVDQVQEGALAVARDALHGIRRHPPGT